MNQFNNSFYEAQRNSLKNFLLSKQDNRNKIIRNKINAATIVLSYPRFKNKWFKYMKLYLHKRIIDEKNLRET